MSSTAMPAGGVAARQWVASAQRRAKVAALGTFFGSCASRSVLTGRDEDRLGEMDRDHFLGPSGRSDLERVSTKDGLGACWRRPRERYKVARDRAKDLDKELKKCRLSVTDLMTQAAETMDKAQMLELTRWVRKEEQRTWETTMAKLKTKMKRMIQREKECKNH